MIWFLQDKESVICEHPLSDVAIAGQAVRPLQDTFHMFLQSVSDVMMYLPPGSALQVCECDWCVMHVCGGRGTAWPKAADVADQRLPAEV